MKIQHDEACDWVPFESADDSVLAGGNFYIKLKSGEVDKVFYKEKKYKKFKSRTKDWVFYSKEEIEFYSYGRFPWVFR
jgi:hypothetical protein